MSYTGKFLSRKEIAMARYEQEVFNARVKRGEINAEEISRTQHVVCGCGAEGCIFISCTKHGTVSKDVSW